MPQYNFTNASNKYGAQMGRTAYKPVKPCRLYLQRVWPYGSGDYDRGGAYWGNLGKHPLFVAFETENESSETYAGEPCTVEIFVRAEDRDSAKQAIQNLYPGVTFYR